MKYLVDFDEQVIEADNHKDATEIAKDLRPQIANIWAIGLDGRYSRVEEET